ncbi:MAG: tRNA(Ile)-lysidine synthase [Thermoleophilaceae bacterium]|nr:tRNA(Ile)-lysidine synthase [Thermoleophilaceae bacterium]
MQALEAARASGLVRAGEPLLVMLSGGADSVCLLDVALTLGADVTALHVNYGLREGASADEWHCRTLCTELEVPLIAEQVELTGIGNMHAEARERRYALAERHAAGDYAAAHTASDQAETVLYRLAVSPGRRALLGMEPRRGRLVRPLLGAPRADTESWCRARGLAWRDDPSNDDPRFARARVRHEVLAALRELNPAAELNIARTAEDLRDEGVVLDEIVRERDAAGAAAALALFELRHEPPAIARLVLRRAAEREGLSLARRDAETILAMDDYGTRALDVGDGGRVLVEYGTVRFTRAGAPAAPEPILLGVPGRVEFGDWVVEARLGERGEAVLDAAVTGDILTVRGWRDGDRMRPAGLGGTKTLQDLFTDAKVPRELRRSLPVVVGPDDEIVWVAGVAVGDRFRAPPGGDAPRVALAARRA